MDVAMMRFRRLGEAILAVALVCTAGIDPLGMVGNRPAEGVPVASGDKAPQILSQQAESTSANFAAVGAADNSPDPRTRDGFGEDFAAQMRNMF